MNVLFIGGTGEISLPCVSEAVVVGHRVTVYNRGRKVGDLPPEVEVVAGDIDDPGAYADLAARGFDVVCQFLALTPDRVERDLAAFGGRTGQYILVSSAAVYDKREAVMPLTEEAPLGNGFWDYARQKIACERVLRDQHRLDFTIVRPAHTIRTRLPTMLFEGDLIGQRMLAGRPVVVADDGDVPWTLTRASDFAVPFVRLFGRPEASGEAVHIAAGKGHGWDDIYRAIARALGVEAQIVRVPAATLSDFNEEWRGPLHGDKVWPTVFDCSKIRRLVGDFEVASDLDEILREPVAHFLRRHAATPSVDASVGEFVDRIVAGRALLSRPYWGLR